jgi:hypothetical protein
VFNKQFNAADQEKFSGRKWAGSEKIVWIGLPST